MKPRETGRTVHVVGNHSLKVFQLIPTYFSNGPCDSVLPERQRRCSSASLCCECAVQLRVLPSWHCIPMKKHNCSRSRTRSRSRSRSHSPPNNREKKYQRGYQNSRDFRGYHRGIRRPFNFRGRGRGCFQRGRYQRGGGGYNNHNFRPNWKNYKQNSQKKQQHQQQQQQQHQYQHQHQHQHQQNYSQGRPQNFQSGSRSPPRDPSQHSDRSPTPLSRHSRHSSSSSHNSSPKFRQNWLPNNQNSNDAKEKSLASKVVQKAGGGDGETGALVAVLAADSKEDTSGGKTEGNWQSSTNCSSSQNRTSPLTSSAASVGPSDQPKSNHPPKITNDIGNGVPSCEASVSSFATKMASQECLNSVLSSFFSNEEYLDGDKNAISIAFGKFLEEQNKKAKALENGNDRETKEVNMEQEKVNGMPSAAISDSVPKQPDRSSDGHFSMKCILKASPFLSTDGEENEETIRAEPKPFHKDWHGSGDLSKLKSQVVRSARDLFDERFSKRQYVAYSQAASSDAMTEDLYLSQKQEKMAGIAAAFSKRESAGKFEDLSADVDLKARKISASSSILCPSPAQRRNPEREMFTIRSDTSPFLFPRTPESKINVRTDFLRESVLGCSDVLAEERQLSQCLVQSSKRDREFRSIFQHIQNAPLERSPSELFAQHIVAIVHHIKAQHFPPCVMTLNERFTMYQRRAAEKEIMKPRKSPEIHRRIDVSPRAFKKHSQLFEAMKSSEDDAYKDAGGKPKSDPMDLRLDIERRKKYCAQEKHQNRGREIKNSGRETSMDKFSKCQKSSKKSKKRRSRSSSSSSSSSSSESQTDELPLDKCHPKDKSLNRGPAGELESPGSVEITRPLGGFQVQIRGRGWDRGSFQENCSHSNNLTVHPNKDEWDPEYTPKSRKYYLHDDREGETDLKCTDNRGRGGFSRGRARFIIRKATSGLSNNSPKWAQEKLGITVEHGAEREKETEQDHKNVREPAGEHS